jgi:hypothetical protein
MVTLSIGTLLATETMNMLGKLVTFMGTEHPIRI